MFEAFIFSKEEISFPRVEVVDRIGDERGQDRAEESGRAGQTGH